MIYIYAMHAGVVFATVDGAEAKRKLVELMCHF